MILRSRAPEFLSYLPSDAVRRADRSSLSLRPSLSIRGVRSGRHMQCLSASVNMLWPTVGEPDTNAFDVKSLTLYPKPDIDSKGFMISVLPVPGAAIMAVMRGVSERGNLHERAATDTNSGVHTSWGRSAKAEL